ncbi:MAG: hypothetical protein Q9215_005959 [Flavoplaca cf. flavocitrina]
MSAKLDMALDDVVMTERTARRRGRGGRRVPNAARKATAPVGGVQKNTRPARGALKPAVANGLAAGGGESKIIPTDVTEKNVKEYFSDTIGPVRRVHLTYGPNGVMRGIVTIVFSRPESAAKALETLNGVQVDKRPMKIEVVLDATKAVAAVPAKGLSDRITNNKGPKAATAAKSTANGAGARDSTRGRGRGGRRGRNAGRAKPKTADELDAEMTDYFDTNAANATGTDGAATNGAVQPVANGADDLGMDEISLAPPRLRARVLARPQNTFSLFNYLFPQTTKRARARLSAFRYESLPRYRHQAQSRIYQLILKRQAKLRQKKATAGGFWLQLLTRRRVSRLAAPDNARRSRLGTAIQKAMAQYGSDTESALGRGTRRKKLAGILKSANELRQSYTQAYIYGPQNDGAAQYDSSGIPGTFPDVTVAQSGDEEMILFPSYAKRHTPGKSGHQNLPGTLHDRREHNAPDTSGYIKQEWDRYEEANSVVDVDVRGWVYAPHKGQISRYNRAMIALARRMSGIPAPSSPRAASPDSAHHLRVEARAQRREQEAVEKQAESIVLKGEGEHNVASRGGYSEAPGQPINKSNSRSPPSGSRATSPRVSSNGKVPHPLEKTSAYHEEQDDAPGPGSLAKRASWNHPSDMSSEELSIANAHMMLRLKPFLTTPLPSTPLTVFFYNEKSSRSRTIYTNEAGHFNLRAALDFIPTHVRVLASDRLSATDEIHITEPQGVSLITDVDDTIKHSAIGAGAREVFRNVFIRDLGDLRIDGVKEWYTKMTSMGVKLHYVSNMPWQLFPVLMSFLSGAGLPKGSFHLKHYTGMLQGIFEPVAERKKGTLERILSDFPSRRFILVGDSGEADLELYTELVQANPGRILGVFIRDVTTTTTQGFFDSSINGENNRTGPRSAAAGSSSTTPNGSRAALKDFEERPKLPPRHQTRSASSLARYG